LERQAWQACRILAGLVRNMTNGAKTVGRKKKCVPNWNGRTEVPTEAAVGSGVSWVLQVSWACPAVCKN